ncbi:MAG: efflux RND transporter periplasmic adaptor subunit [Patescibacteria group bacterium]
MTKKIIIFIKNIFAFIKKHWKLSLFLVVIILGIIFWRYKKSQQNIEDLNFEKPQIENLTKVIEVSGVVDAKEKARLRFIAGGRVTYIGAQEGEEVKKWQTIASIDRATLKKQMQQDLNLYMKERWDFEQSKDDTGDYDLLPLETRRTRDKEQWDLENEVLDVEIASIAIKNTAIYAPFDGILTVSPSKVAGVQLLSTDYFELVNPKTLVFRATVDEADIAQIKKGQVASLELDSYPDKIFSSNVDYISYTSSQSSSGTVFIVEFPLSNGSLDELRIGMNGDVAITVDTRDQVMSIPFEATRERDDKILIDVKTGEKTFEEKEIKIDLETEEKVEVISGLSLEDEILIPK